MSLIRFTQRDIGTGVHLDNDTRMQTGICGGIECLQPATEYRAGLDGRIQHARQAKVSAEDLLAVQFVIGIQALDWLAATVDWPLSTKLVAIRAGAQVHMPSNSQLCEV